jgi:hypothetical protein
MTEGLEPVKETVEARMQRAAEDQLEQVQEAFWALEADPDDEVAQNEVGLWCGGCDTCYVREVLEAAVPILLDAIRSGEFTLEEPAAEVMSNVHHFPGSRA